MAPAVPDVPFVLRDEPPPHEPELDMAWFDAPARRSSRPPRSVRAPASSPSKGPPPLPIDDPIADRWFR